MAQFTIEVPDELAPGVIATANMQGKSPEEVVQEYAIALATQTCQDLFVGPYFRGPIPPQFNADGTVYVAPAEPEDPEEPAAPEEE